MIGASYREFTAVLETAGINELLEWDLALVERAAREKPNAAFYTAYLLEKKIASESSGSPDPLDPEKAARMDAFIFSLYQTALRDEVVRDEAAQRLRPFVLRNREHALKIIRIKANSQALRTLKAASFFTLRSYDEVLALYKGQAVFEGAETMTSWDSAFLLLSRLIQSSPKSGPYDAALHKEAVLHDEAALYEEAALHDEAVPDEEAGLPREISAFFLSGEIDAARRWCWEEIMLRELVPFSKAEENAVRGRFLTADYAYGNALALFRLSYAHDARLFSRNGDLFTDLGRAFLYGGNQEDGAALFTRWEAEAALGDAQTAGDSQTARESPESPDFRYKCLYYAGRMMRSSGKPDRAAEYFTRAVEIAPDDEQRDACIWYIVEMGFNKKIETGIALLEQWADKWHDGDYFADLYDRVAQWAVERKRWSTLVRLFQAVEQGNSGRTRAKYAYIIGRALEEGRTNPIDRPPDAFFAIAYNETAAPYYYDEAFLYYRAMAGFRLGKEPAFIDIEKREEAAGTAITTKEGLFLEGFFTYGAKNYAAAWIKDYAETLPLDELRVLVSMVSDEGFWGEAIRLCVVYMKRPDFVVTPPDIALFYPRGYAELVSAYAKQYAIDEGILFGVIRTESIFIPDIVSRAGAGGLMQLMPETALDTARTIAVQGGPDYVVDGTVDRANPEANIHIGTSFLRHLLNTQETPLHAILSYNGGPTRIRRLARASNLPPDLFMESLDIKETREYGKKVLASAILYDYSAFSLKSDTFIADILGN
ncbi:MAG: lytic transglycosylase domain-containing protein [Spirochaetaceae bacterium]|nr:lytic transglycosylase domain-containing protein [Spirochaetaceae bacterium]